MLQTVLDLAWIARDVSKHTRYNQPSEFIDLVAGGNRGFCDQPHLFYCAALIEITPGREYTMRIAPSDAVSIHAVMTSSRGGVSTQTCWSTRTEGQAGQEQVVRICASPNDPMVLDSSPHHGLCTTFVRLYFLERVGSRYDQAPLVTMTKLGTPSRRIPSAAAVALWKFLPIREITVLKKWVEFTLRIAGTANVWLLNDVDERRGFRARIKEFLVNQRGRYFSLILSLREGETLEVRYRRQPNTWASLAFVTPETRTLDYINLSRREPDADGWIHLKVGQDSSDPAIDLCTQGRRKGTLLLREVSIDGRDLSKKVEDIVRASVHPPKSF